MRRRNQNKRRNDDDSWEILFINIYLLIQFNDIIIDVKNSS